MIKKKNGFFTFLCSLIPGAGEMYLGFMKEGISIMGVAFALFYITTNLIDELFFLMPLVWFYSFFNVHNKASLSDEEFYALEDDYVFHLDKLIPDGSLSGKQSKLLGWVLIALGAMIIWKPMIGSFLASVRTYISESAANTIQYVLYQLPKYAIAVGLILFGLYLIRNKKEKLEEEADQS